MFTNSKKPIEEKVKKATPNSYPPKIKEMFYK